MGRIYCTYECVLSIVELSSVCTLIYIIELRAMVINWIIGVNNNQDYEINETLWFKAKIKQYILFCGPYWKWDSKP